MEGIALAEQDTEGRRIGLVRIDSRRPSEEIRNRIEEKIGIFLPGLI